VQFNSLFFVPRSLSGHLRLFGVTLLTCLIASVSTVAQLGQAPDRSAENLMVVVREAIGINTEVETLAPMNKVRAKLPDGKEVEFELAAFLLLGDMHVRFVFDGPNFMLNARPQDLARLNLNATDALKLAMANIKRVYGDPVAKPWEKGLMQVEGKSPDLDSSYFLDREFWQLLLRQHPEGLVIAVPKRGTLLYSPLTERTAVDWLRSNISHLHASSGKMRVSAALYLFKDDRFTVFQPAKTE
jgi:hypothetical protein